jgi:putative membrane protein (TIGR04086 family)
LLGGVFLFIKENGKLPDARFLLRAVTAWMISACVLVFLAAMAANAFRLGERGLAYLSSAVSFLTAAAAGIFSDRARNASRLAVSLISATTLVIILLTVGYLVRGEEMNSSAVLSIVSFTYAGVLAGVFLQPSGKGNGRKYHNRKLT